MKTTKFKEYAHYKWVLRDMKRNWGCSKSKLFLAYCLFFHWINDLGRIIEGRQFKRDKVGNILDRNGKI